VHVSYIEPITLTQVQREQLEVSYMMYVDVQLHIIPYVLIVCSALGPFSSSDEEDITQVCCSHGGYMELCKTRLKNMDPS